MASYSPSATLNLSRETIKRLLAFPPDTNIVWKSHDDSIAQRSAIDLARHEKSNGNNQHNSDKRRGNHNDESTPDRGKPTGS